MTKCRQMLWCTAIYINASCEPSARLSNPGPSVWTGLTNAASSSSSKAAKPRNNYTPRFVFYRKKHTLFTQKRVLSHKKRKCPALPLGTLASRLSNLQNFQAHGCLDFVPPCISTRFLASPTHVASCLLRFFCSKLLRIARGIRCVTSDQQHFMWKE